MIHATNEKPPGAIHTKGLPTDTTNDLKSKFALSVYTPPKGLHVGKKYSLNDDGTVNQVTLGPLVRADAPRSNCAMSNNTSRGANMPQAIYRFPAAKSESGYSRSTIYLRIAQGLWPKQVSLGPRCVGWSSYEVAALNAARIAGKNVQEIRELVAKLEATRKTAGVQA